MIGEDGRDGHGQKSGQRIPDARDPAGSGTLANAVAKLCGDTGTGVEDAVDSIAGSFAGGERVEHVHLLKKEPVLPLPYWRISPRNAGSSP